MGFLDELEEKARKQRESEELAAVAREEKEVFFREIAEPTFRELFDYVKRLTDHLNYLGSRREVRYAAPSYGKITGRMNDDLRVRFSSDDESRSIDIVGTVEIPRQRALDVLDMVAVSRLKSFLHERGLHSGEQARRNSSGHVISSTFRASGEVNLRALITTSIDRPDFHMTFTNLSEFGQLVKVVPPEQMDQPLMDKLGRFIAQVDEEFLREDLDDGIREELARKLKKDRSRQVSALTQTERQRKREAMAEKERIDSARKLSGRFQFRMDALKKKLSDKS